MLKLILMSRANFFPMFPVRTKDDQPSVSTETDKKKERSFKLKCYLINETIP